MRFIVAHTGARRGYAVPLILQRAGLLERFYTGVCASVGLGKFVCMAGRLIGNPPAIQRLRSRQLAPELVRKTRTFWRPNIWYFLRMLTAGTDAAQLYRTNLQWQCRLGEMMAAEGFGNATWLHSFLDEFPTLVFAAKRAGLKIVSELVHTSQHQSHSLRRAQPLSGLGARPARLRYHYPASAGQASALPLHRLRSLSVGGRARRRDCELWISPRTNGPGPVRCP